MSGDPTRSQSVKTAALLNQSVGYDAGSRIKGRKRFASVDTLGLVLSVFVTAASQTEREGGKVVLERLKDKGTRVARLHTIWAARFGCCSVRQPSVRARSPKPRCSAVPWLLLAISWFLITLGYNASKYLQTNLWKIDPNVKKPAIAS